jgi:hypothetical protein
MARTKTPKPESEERKIIRVRIVELMGEKQKALGRVLRPSEVIGSSGASKNIVYRAINGTLKEMPFDQGLLLARYFGIRFGDLFEEIDAPEDTDPPS